MSRRLRIRRLAHAADLPLPRYETAGAAGMDLVAANPSDAPIVLAAPGASAGSHRSRASSSSPASRRRCGPVPGLPSSMA